MISKSYPVMSIAEKYGVPYGDALLICECLLQQKMHWTKPMCDAWMESYTPELIDDLEAHVPAIYMEYARV